MRSLDHLQNRLLGIKPKHETLQSGRCGLAVKPRNRIWHSKPVMKVSEQKKNGKTRKKNKKMSVQSTFGVSACKDEPSTVRFGQRNLALGRPHEQRLLARPFDDLNESVKSASPGIYEELESSKIFNADIDR